MTKTSRKPKLPVLHRLIRDMSSEAYHGTSNTWSSSQLKDVLEDEEVFIKKYITKEVERVEREVFDTGTYFHTSVLEPHKVASEIVLWEGKARRGSKWEAFKKKHPGKVIINQKQKLEGDGMTKGVKASPICKKYLKGEPEVSLFIRLLVADMKIYAPAFGKVLSPTGWRDCGKIPAKGVEFILKCRSDCLGNIFISDLKSTSGSAKKKASVRNSISKYNYDLSAALYLDLFSLVNPSVGDFYWIFASKENFCAVTWRASPKNILVGRAKWSKALLRMADLQLANWEIVDYVREAEPLPHELEWLNERDIDLL